MLESESNGDNVSRVIDGVLRCADGLPRQDPMSAQIADAMLVTVSNRELDGNLRKQGLAVFANVDTSPEVFEALRALAADEKHPVMRRFIAAAIERAEAAAARQ